MALEICLRPSSRTRMLPLYFLNNNFDGFPYITINSIKYVYIISYQYVIKIMQTVITMDFYDGLITIIAITETAKTKSIPPITICLFSIDLYSDESPPNSSTILICFLSVGE
jgi:hypothetical protein